MNTYKVKFYNPATGQGFIDGFRTARRAKNVAQAFQAQFHKDGGKGIYAQYLGRDLPHVNGDAVLLRKFGLRA